MKKLLLSAALLAAVTANAGPSDSVSTSLRQSGNGSLTLVNGSLELFGDSADSTSRASGQIYNASEDLVVAGWAASKNGASYILTSARQAGAQSAGSSKAVVSGTGQLIVAGLTASGKAVRFVVNETGELLADSGRAVVGSVKWSGKKLSAGSEVVVNASGRALTASGKVIGTAVDASGRVLTFAVDKSGKVLVASKDSVIVVATASGKAVKALAQALGKGVKALTYGIADVSMTVLVTSDVAAHALSTGNLPKSSEVLLTLPSHMLKAAFGSEFHWRTIRQ